jgi:hypothetical protein
MGTIMWRGLVAVLRFVFRPFGYLAFVLALAALSATARMLGDSHELGYFAGRMAQAIWRYPEITRRGVQMAWAVWAALFLLAVSPISATKWDEVVLAALALAVFWRRFVGGHRVAR